MLISHDPRHLEKNRKLENLQEILELNVDTVKILRHSR